ncbi:DUF58 domain-containing protein [bacterium]|nr:DUF58 domain-containing protein [bacterium]
MLSPEIIKKIKQIEIHIKRLLSGSHVGDYSSAKKGSGFEFDQIRDYQFGDDVRFIDWKSTAKSNKLLVKQYIEERNRSVIIAVDISSSHFFSSSHQKKSDIIAQIAAVLALVTDYGNDHAALLLFSDEIELVVPSSSGRKHIHCIMKHLFSYKPKSKKTDLNSVLKTLASMKHKDAIVFLISDFIDCNFEKLLRVVARQYDLVAIRCLDKNEQEFPHVGFLTVDDIETGQQIMIDTRKRSSSDISDFLSKRLADQTSLFKKCGVDVLNVFPEKPFISDIVKFFRRRMLY